MTASMKYRNAKYTSYEEDRMFGRVNVCVSVSV